MTICQIDRNNALERVQAVVRGEADPGRESTPSTVLTRTESSVNEQEVELHDLAATAHDQIVEAIQERFQEHDLARLVEAVLEAEGWITSLSPPGPDGGVDILGGRGALGLDAPRICVQVKSGSRPAGPEVYRSLHAPLTKLNADQGLLVSWSGFTKSVRTEARRDHFSIRLWDSGDLVDAIYRSYRALRADIRAQLPLDRVWMLVPEDED